MRYAEHMLLMSKVHGLVPYWRDDRKGNRCALGLVESEGRCAEVIYPWIAETAAYLPCGCNYALVSERMPDYNSKVILTIVHLFNEHVMQGKIVSPEAEPWTMEQLADWIDSVDPTPREIVAEPAPTTVTETVCA